MKAAIAAIVLQLLASSIHSDRKRVAILPTIRGGDEAPANLVEAITRELELRPGLDPVTSSELLTGTDDPLIGVTERCGADLECIRDRVKANGIDLALRVIVNHAVDPALVSVHLVETASATIVAEAFGDAAEDVVSVSATLAMRVFDEAGYREGGRIIVDVSPKDADVTLDDVTHGSGPSRFVVEAGPHRIEARRDGYAPQAEIVQVVRGREARVAFSLVELEPESIVSSPWLWIAVGVLAAAIGAGIAAGVALAPRNESLCPTTLGGPDC